MEEVGKELREFYQEWFNALSKEVHFLEYKLEEIDYRFTLIEDKLLRLEDRVNEITQVKTR